MSPRKPKARSQALVPVAAVPSAPPPSTALPEEGKAGDMAQADMETIAEIFSRYLPSVTAEEARMALRRTLTDYRQQLGAFMVAVSKAKMSRLVRLINALDTIEDKVLSPEKLQNATMTELTKLWAVAQGAAQMDIDLIERTAKGDKGAPSNSTTIVNVVGTAAEASLLDGYGLDANQRARVRDILTSFLAQMGKTGTSEE